MHRLRIGCRGDRTLLPPPTFPPFAAGIGVPPKETSLDMQRTGMTAEGIRREWIAAWANDRTERDHRQNIRRNCPSRLGTVQRNGIRNAPSATGPNGFSGTGSPNGGGHSASSRLPKTRPAALSANRFRAGECKTIKRGRPLGTVLRTPSRIRPARYRNEPPAFRIREHPRPPAGRRRHGKPLLPQRPSFSYGTKPDC